MAIKKNKTVLVRMAPAGTLSLCLPANRKVGSYMENSSTRLLLYGPPDLGSDLGNEGKEDQDRNNGYMKRRFHALRWQGGK